MELMLIIVYLFSLLKCNTFEHIDLQKNFDNITSIKFNSFRIIRPVTETAIWKGNYTFNPDYGCLSKCFWIPFSYCNYETKECVCRSEFVRVGNKCLQKRYVLGGSCSDSKQCQVDRSYCFLNKCTCKHGYKSSFANLSCVEKIEKNLGDTCYFLQHCVTPNSDCIGGRCRCKAGFEEYGYRCEIIYDKTSKKLAVTDIILISLAALVIFVILIVSGAFCRKRRPVVESSTTQNSTVYIPPENTIYFPEMNTPVYLTNENNEFNARYYRSEPTLDNLDKPPSYEEVIRSSRSTENLANNTTIQESSCPSYAATMTTVRTCSSSIR